MVGVSSLDSKVYSEDGFMVIERLISAQTPLVIMSIPILEDYLVWVLSFLERMAPTLLQHTTL